MSNAVKVGLTVCLLAVVMLTGCAMTVTPATGFLYTDAKGPWAATSNEGGSKVGTSECSSILGWVATGDASIQAAMANGGIQKIHHVDFHSSNILSIYAKMTTYVYGE